MDTKRFGAILLVVCLPALVAAQVWTEHTVDDNFDGAYCVHAEDLDGDGDTDVLGAAIDDNYISWWENSDGSGTTWTEHIVDDAFIEAESVHAADVDGDGDIDVLGAAWGDNDITWWENVDGTGTTWSEHIVDGDYISACSIWAVDLDGDGDTDVLGASHSNNDIVWWENTAGTGTSWIEHTVTDMFDGVETARAADIDGDGDLDVIGAAYGSDDITWWENVDGNGTSWIEHIVDEDFGGASSISVNDVDGDGDADVLGSAWTADAIAWWENTDGSGTSWTEHSIGSNFEGAWFVYSTDLDGDGDIDALGAAYTADDIKWWENTDGMGTSWTEHVLNGEFDGASFVYAADVDGDGDNDVLGSAQLANQISWWENPGDLDVNEQFADPYLPEQYDLLPVYPNPFNPTATVTVALPHAGELELTVFNVAGQQINLLASGTFSAGTHTFTLDGSNLASGIYLVRAIIPGDLNQVQKVVLVR